jgi:hypothetical protein
MPTVPTAAEPQNSYDLMASRIQRIINSSAAQKAKSALIYRSSEESQAEWERILGEIGENDNVTIAHRDDCAVQLLWTVPTDE